jgi:hypothetical protein
MRLLSVNIQFTFFMHDADSLLICADYRQKLSYTIIHLCVSTYSYMKSESTPLPPNTHADVASFSVSIVPSFGV